MTTSKARRILKRTAVGSSLAGALSLMLWLASRSSEGRPVLIGGAVVLLAAILETSRMGRFATRDLAVVLLASAGGALGLARSAMATLPQKSVYDAFAPALERAYQPKLALEYGWVVMIATATFALNRALQHFARLSPSAPRVITYTVVGAILIYVAGDPFETQTRLRVGFVLFAVLAACALPLALRDRQGLRAKHDLAIAVLVSVWLVPPLPALWGVWCEWGTRGLIALLVLSKIGDTFGYYVGNAIGRSHPFPNISPGKTTAGCVGSLVGGTATGALLGVIGLFPPHPFGPLAGALAGLVINVAAQAGDLLESWVKRRAHVKDSSTIFGPSGGLLDQIDSLLLSVPVAVFVWPWIFHAR